MNLDAVIVAISSVGRDNNDATYSGLQGKILDYEDAEAVAKVASERKKIKFQAVMDASPEGGMVALPDNRTAIIVNRMGSRSDYATILSQLKNDPSALTAEGLVLLAHLEDMCKIDVKERKVKII